MLGLFRVKFLTFTTSALLNYLTLSRIHLLIIAFYACIGKKLVFIRILQCYNVEPFKVVLLKKLTFGNYCLVGLLCSLLWHATSLHILDCSKVIPLV